MSPMLLGLGFKVEIKKDIFENLLVPSCNCENFDIWYVASSSGPLPSLSIWCPWVKACPVPGVTSWNLRTKKDNFKILEGLELWYLVYSISLWTFTKFVYMMPLGSKLAPPRGHKLEHRNKHSKLQNSFLKLQGVELWYLVCSNALLTSTKFFHMMPLGSKSAPPQESQDGT